MAINYYLCTGENPQNDPYEHNKFPLNAIIPFTTLIVYLSFSIRLAYHKFKVNKFHSSGAPPCPVLTKETVSFLASTIVSLAVMIDSTMWNLVIYTMTPEEIMADTFGKFSSKKNLFLS